MQCTFKSSTLSPKVNNNIPHQRKKVNNYKGIDFLTISIIFACIIKIVKRSTYPISEHVTRRSNAP